MKWRVWSPTSLGDFFPLIVPQKGSMFSGSSLSLRHKPFWCHHSEDLIWSKKTLLSPPQDLDAAANLCVNITAPPLNKHFADKPCSYSIGTQYSYTDRIGGEKKEYRSLPFTSIFNRQNKSQRNLKEKLFVARLASPNQARRKGWLQKDRAQALF